MRNDVAQHKSIDYGLEATTDGLRFGLSRRHIKLWFLFVLVASVIGCSTFNTGRAKSYLTVPEQPNQNATKAKKLNAEGIACLEKGKIAEAEELFRQSLAEDIDYGPAHNNLGQVYLGRNDLYQAAWEFEFASNLMPERPECLVNLGLVYERANRLQDAVVYYESALEVQPNHVAAIANLARVYMKMESDSSRTRELLRQLVMMDQRPRWNRWARDMLAIRFGDFGLDSVPLGEAMDVEEIVVPGPQETSLESSPGQHNALPPPRLPLRLNQEHLPSTLLPLGTSRNDEDPNALKAVAKELPPGTVPSVQEPVTMPQWPKAQ